MKFQVLVKQMSSDAFLASSYMPGFSSAITAFGRTQFDAVHNLKECIEYALTDGNVIMTEIDIPKLTLSTIKNTRPDVSRLTPIDPTKGATEQYAANKKRKGRGPGKKKLLLQSSTTSSLQPKER